MSSAFFGDDCLKPFRWLCQSAVGAWFKVEKLNWAFLLHRLLLIYTNSCLFFNSLYQFNLLNCPRSPRQSQNCSLYLWICQCAPFNSSSTEFQGLCLDVLILHLLLYRSLHSIYFEMHQSKSTNLFSVNKLSCCNINHPEIVGGLSPVCQERHLPLLLKYYPLKRCCR